MSTRSLTLKQSTNAYGNLVYQFEIPVEVMQERQRTVPDFHDVDFAPGFGISLDVDKDQGWPLDRPGLLDIEGLPAQLMRLAYLVAMIENDR